MRISKLTIKNVLSFRDETEIEFDDSLNILVGPNGGGKSNLLDILTVILRGYFLKSYRVDDNRDENGLFRLTEFEPFGDLAKALQRFDGNSSDCDMMVTFAIDANDLENMKKLSERAPEIDNALSRYRNGGQFRPRFLEFSSESVFVEGTLVSYHIHNFRLQGDGDTNSVQSVYMDYLNRFELLLLLATEVEGLHLTPSYLYFSPFRGGASQGNLEANLSSDNYTHQLTGYYGARSRTTTSLVKLATLRFADKRRRLEVAATRVGFEDAWEHDPEVVLLTKHLARLGFSWKLQSIDPRRNIYKIALETGGRNLDLGSVSAGEQEIINYLLGLFALNLRGGLLIIDEAEIHLHPQWQRMLADLLAEISLQSKTQILLSTHSASFIGPKTARYVTRVYKDDTHATRLKRLLATSTEKDATMLRMINAHNNERMFFSNRVLLVEGITDRLVVEALVTANRNRNPSTEIVEVLEVQGKAQFTDYRDFLKGIEVDVAIIADLDYLVDVRADLKSLFDVDTEGIEKNVVNNKKSKDALALMKCLETAKATGNFEELDKLMEHIKARHRRLRRDLDEDASNRLNGAIAEQRAQGVYILRHGEIEDYLPANLGGSKGVIEFTQSEKFTEWIGAESGDERVAELVEIVALALS